MNVALLTAVLLLGQSSRYDAGASAGQAARLPQVQSLNIRVVELIALLMPADSG